MDLQTAGVAQLVEQWFCKPQVVGSIPSAGFLHRDSVWADVAQLVEQLFRKQQVASSILAVGFLLGQLIASSPDDNI